MNHASFLPDAFDELGGQTLLGLFHESCFVVDFLSLGRADIGTHL